MQSVDADRSAARATRRRGLCAPGYAALACLLMLGVGLMSSPLSRPFGLRSIDGFPLPVEIFIGGVAQLVASGRLQLLEYEPTPGLPNADGVVQWELYRISKADGTPSPTFLSRKSFGWRDACTVRVPAADYQAGPVTLGEFIVSLGDGEAEVIMVPPPDPSKRATFFGSVKRFTFAVEPDAPDLQPFARSVLDP